MNLMDNILNNPKIKETVDIYNRAKKTLIENMENILVDDVVKLVR
jgi:hypothetical protein